MNQPSTASLIGQVVLPGLLIVFIALIILVLAVLAMGKIMSRRKQKLAASQAPSAPSAASASPSSAPAAARDSGIPGETVAAIAAAIAVTMAETSPGVPYSITSVHRARTTGRPVWGFAGMQQNTRPF